MDFDAIVLGGGPAGEHCAGRLANGGLRVALVERELVGGECSYWACIPSKTLLRPGEALSGALQAPGAREAVGGGLRLDAAAAFAWRDFMVSDYSDKGQEDWLRSAEITLLRGAGRLAGPGAVEVDGERHTARDVVLATGSDPVVPPIDGLDEVDPDRVWGNREVTGMTEVPEHLIVLGAGPVGTEMAQAARRLGARVTVIVSGDRVLPHEPPDVGHAVTEALRSDGVELRCRAHASRVRGAVTVELDDGSSVEGDRLLLATGRRPRADGLGLDSVGVETTDRGAVPVDGHLRVTDGLWAIGDVTGVWPLTYVGKYQGRIVAANILGGDVQANYDAVPRVVFTDPQAASVGEDDGERVARIELSSVPRTSTYTREYDKRPGFLRLVSDGERLTGAQAVGPEAGEWLQQATLAIRARIPLDVLRDTIQPFPTFSESFLFALDELRD